MRQQVLYGDMLDQYILSGFPTIGFYLIFYANKYNVQHSDALPGGISCDSPLDILSMVTNKLESVFGSHNHAAIKNACTWMWSVFEQ